MITRQELKKIRKESGLAQHEFAKAIGLNFQTQVSCLERGSYPMTEELSEKILNFKKDFKELKNLFKSGHVTIEEISKNLSEISDGKNMHAYITKGINNFPSIKFDFKANSKIMLKNKCFVKFLD